jgi:hypothetical protein
LIDGGGSSFETPEVSRQVTGAVYFEASVKLFAVLSDRQIADTQDSADLFAAVTLCN